MYTDRLQQSGRSASDLLQKAVSPYPIYNSRAVPISFYLQLAKSSNSKKARSSTEIRVGLLRLRTKRPDCVRGSEEKEIQVQTPYVGKEENKAAQPKQSNRVLHAYRRQSREERKRKAINQYVVGSSQKRKLHRLVKSIGSVGTRSILRIRRGRDRH
jgi:hypothetical protein